jgi:hypothetical protein
LLSPSHLEIAHAQAVVTVDLERAHARFLDQSTGLVVVGFSGLNLWGLPTRGDLAEEV